MSRNEDHKMTREESGKKDGKATPTPMIKNFIKKSAKKAEKLLPTPMTRIFTKKLVKKAEKLTPTKIKTLLIIA